jgi:hypothetical protein
MALRNAARRVSLNREGDLRLYAGVNGLGSAGALWQIKGLTRKDIEEHGHYLQQHMISYQRPGF